MKYPPKIDPKTETTKITTFIKNTFKNTKKSKAVVPISGGIDSATSLLLTSKALKPENIHPIHLPSKTTDPIHTQHTNALLDLVEIPQKNRIEIPIKAIIQKTWRIIKNYSPPIPLAEKGKKDRKKHNLQVAHLKSIRIGNIAARIRMLLIYDHAKRHDALVVGTENHSEHLLGYYTRFGDEASDLEPILHLYKTQLRDLAKHLKVPKAILEKPPTAGLWPNQTDESELGFSYQLADPILYLHYEKQLSPNQIAKKISPITQKDHEETIQLAKKVIKRCEDNCFKQQTPYLLS